MKKMFNFEKDEKRPVAFRLSDTTYNRFQQMKSKVEQEIGDNLTHEEFFLGILNAEPIILLTVANGFKKGEKTTQ